MIRPINVLFTFFPTVCFVDRRSNYLIKPDQHDETRQRNVWGGWRISKTAPVSLVYFFPVLCTSTCAKPEAAQCAAYSGRRRAGVAWRVQWLGRAKQLRCIAVWIKSKNAQWRSLTFTHRASRMSAQSDVAGALPLPEDCSAQLLFQWCFDLVAPRTHMRSPRTCHESWALYMIASAKPSKWWKM